MPVFVFDVSSDQSCVILSYGQRQSDHCASCSFLCLHSRLAGSFVRTCERCLPRRPARLSAQGGARIGLLSASSEEDLRNTVIRKAGNHDIVLKPSQVIVEKQGTPEYPFVYIAADYKARVSLPGFSFELHFTPASKHM